MGELNQKYRHRWIGVLMKSGILHIKRYNGPYNFRRSFAYQQYSTSPYVQKLIGPITVSVKVDHEAIIRQKAAR